MIQFLENNKIDKQRWDQCISSSVNRQIYGWSWYLDRVCPGWNALVSDNYEAVFPLTWNRKWGITYLYQPYFTQQLGVFSIHPVTEKLVSEFIESIPANIRFGEIQLNASNNFPVREWELNSRINHELPLFATYAVIQSGYSQNTKRNLKKSAEAGVYTGDNPGVDTMIDLFRTNFGSREGKLGQRHYDMLNTLIRYILDHGHGEISGVYDASHVLSAAALFAVDKNRAYFLFAASSPAARENGAMFSLIDRFVQNHSGSDIILDFEGGNDPQLGRFYKSFGAAEVHYPQLRMNRLPAVVRLAYKYARSRGKRENNLSL